MFVNKFLMIFVEFERLFFVFCAIHPSPESFFGIFVVFFQIKPKDLFIVLGLGSTKRWHTVFERFPQKEGCVTDGTDRFQETKGFFDLCGQRWLRHGNHEQQAHLQENPPVTFWPGGFLLRKQTDCFLFSIIIICSKKFKMVLAAFQNAFRAQFADFGRKAAAIHL